MIKSALNLTKASLHAMIKLIDSNLDGEASNKETRLDSTKILHPCDPHQTLHLWNCHGYPTQIDAPQDGTPGKHQSYGLGRIRN